LKEREEAEKDAEKKTKQSQQTAASTAGFNGGEEDSPEPVKQGSPEEEKKWKEIQF